MSCAAVSDESAALFTRTNIAAFLAGGLAIGAAAYILGKQHSAAVGSGRCNTKIATPAGEEKVKHIVEIEDIGDKKVFCRCWKSTKFPYCDQAHNKHNKETGDNVGPLVIKKGVAA